MSDARREATLRRFLEANLEGEPAVEALAPGFVYEQHFGNTAGAYEGEAGIRRWIETFHEIWDEARLELHGVRDAGERSLGEISVHVRGGQTGIEVELRAWAVAAFAADGRLARVDTYNEPGEADQALDA